MKSKTAKYVELVGVAGVGKTTVAGILIKEAHKIKIPLQAREIVGKNIWFRLKVIYKIIIVLISAPEIFSLYFVNLRHDFQKTPHIKKIKRDLITRLVIDMAVIYCMLQNSSKHIINDEGLIGKLISLSVIAEISSSKVCRLIKKLLPKFTILTYVNSSPILALNRESKREINLPFFNDMDYKLKEFFFYQAVKMYKSLPTLLVEMSNIKEFSISNSKNYDHLVTEVILLAKRINAIILQNEIRDI